MKFTDLVNVVFGWFTGSKNSLATIIKLISGRCTYFLSFSFLLFVLKLLIQPNSHTATYA